MKFRLCTQAPRFYKPFKLATRAQVESLRFTEWATDTALRHCSVSGARAYKLGFWSLSSWSQTIQLTLQPVSALTDGLANGHGAWDTQLQTPTHRILSQLHLKGLHATDWPGLGKSSATTVPIPSDTARWVTEAGLLSLQVVVGIIACRSNMHVLRIKCYARWMRLQLNACLEAMLTCT